MSKPVSIIAFLIVLTTVIYIFFQAPEKIVVRTHTVTRGLVKTTVANTRVGTVKACRRAYLAPATGGQVAKLHVREGAAVKQDQILLEVWNDDLQAQVELQTAEIAAKQAVAKQLCFLAQGAVRDAERLKKLQKHDRIVSENDVDDAITSAKAQQALCRSSKARIDVSIASLSLAKAAVERTQVAAPFTGIVAEVNAELGEFVTPSPPGIPTLPAIDLLDMSCMYISAPIDEVDAPQIKIGMPTCVVLDAFTDRRCSGTVRRIAPYVLEKEKQARTVEVEVTFSDTKELLGLLPGYSADIEILLASKQQALRIPAEAVLENNQVLLMQEDGLLETRTIVPGLSNWDYIEVLSGLSSGEKVVLSVGQEGVIAGAYASDTAP